ncbi:hypothetical protein AI2913V1_2751 [Klebsiella aerogenes]|nr:hypothetical protein AI2913V1_2751 [Klebsiella aerogenes]CAH5885907.1 hypothetical protein AI2913V1_2751 [Klebsiella aerogenes]VAG17839.1 Transposase [Klebsiella aerogenes]
MSGKRYSDEFKIEAVKQVVDRGHSVSSVATRLDITTHSLYVWIKKYGPDSSTHNEQPDAQAGIRRLQTDQMLTRQIKQFWLESGCVYGYRKCVIPDRHKTAAPVANIREFSSVIHAEYGTLLQDLRRE